MVYYEYTFSISELALLDELIGQTWNCYGTPRAWDSASTLGDVYLITDNHQITLFSEVDWFEHAGILDYEGNLELDQVANLSIEPGAEQLFKAEELGLIYVFNHGEVVQNVFVVRDAISFRLNGEHQWDMVKDTGIIIQFESGVIAFTQLATYMETLGISRASSIEELNSPEMSTSWENRQLGDDFQWSRKVIPIGDLKEEK